MPSQSENWQKYILPRLPFPPNVKTVQICPYKTTTAFQSENCPKSVLVRLALPIVRVLSPGTPEQWMCIVEPSHTSLMNCLFFQNHLPSKNIVSTQWPVSPRKFPSVTNKCPYQDHFRNNYHTDSMGFFSWETLPSTCRVASPLNGLFKTIFWVHLYWVVDIFLPSDGPSQERPEWTDRSFLSVTKNGLFKTIFPVQVYEVIELCLLGDLHECVEAFPVPLMNGHFKTIFQVPLYWCKELCLLGDLNNQSINQSINLSIYLSIYLSIRSRWYPVMPMEWFMVWLFDCCIL